MIYPAKLLDGSLVSLSRDADSLHMTQRQLKEASEAIRSGIVIRISSYAASFAAPSRLSPVQGGESEMADLPREQHHPRNQG